MKKTVVIGLSGGIDSTVAAMLLQQKGYDVIGVFFHLWADAPEGKNPVTNKCCSLETQERARFVCQKLNIPFHTLDISKKFKDIVVDYFLQAYEKGLTPNPCVVCNRDIKFGIIFDYLKQFNADYFATGHYAINEQREDGYHLLKGKDLNKDQTYFLYTLTQEKLSKILFPLGHLEKKAVKQMAQVLNIEAYEAGYKESQNLCFYPEDTPEKFLERYVPTNIKTPGPIKLLNGTIVGEHNGLFRYTIGQRKGIKIGGLNKPLYVTRLSKIDNTLFVGEEKDLFSDTCLLEDCTFISENAPEKLLHVEIKPRYTKQPVLGDIVRDGNLYRIHFHEPVRALTPGQSAVIYDGEDVIGGGIIKNI